MHMLHLVGPAAMVGAVAFVYCLTHTPQPTRCPVGTRTLCILLLLVYLSGIVPRNRFFPSFFFRTNVFDLLYRLYCTHLVGYSVLRHVLHQPTPYPHSDYRYGVRCLRDCGMPLRPPLLPTLESDKPVSAAAAVASASWLRDPRSFYGRGGGVIEVAALRDERERWARKGGVLVVPVPMFADNYAYLLVSLATGRVAAVDPADPHMVLRVLRVLRRQCEVPFVLTDILTTHKHWDHAGGNATLLAYARSADNVAQVNTNDHLVSPDLVVIGATVDDPLGCTRLVDEATGAFAVAGGGVWVRALAVPGHTAGSVMYLACEHRPDAATNGRSDDDEADEAEATGRLALFTGDSLFCGGYGAPFETTSVEQVIETRRRFCEDVVTRTHPVTGRRVRDTDVLLYVGHEYTERLLSEVDTSMQRCLATSGCTPDCRRFAVTVRATLREVKELRQASDGLDDVARVETERARRGGSRNGVPKARFRLPLCTVPSTLELERRVNPLLTVDPTALRAVQMPGSELDRRQLEAAIYGSPARCMPSDNDEVDVSVA